MNNNLPEIVLGIVQNNEKKVLIIQRAKVEKGTGDTKLSWAFPGGTREQDETKEETVEREILEETGYITKAGAVISQRQHPQFPVYVYYILCTLTNTEKVKTSQDEEIQQALWVEPTNLHKYFTTDMDKNVSEYLGM